MLVSGRWRINESYNGEVFALRYYLCIMIGRPEKVTSQCQYEIIKTLIYGYISVATSGDQNVM